MREQPMPVLPPLFEKDGTCLTDPRYAHRGHSPRRLALATLIQRLSKRTDIPPASLPTIKSPPEDI